MCSRFKWIINTFCLFENNMDISVSIDVKYIFQYKKSNLMKKF